MRRRKESQNDAPVVLRILVLGTLIVGAFICHIGLRTAIVTEGYRIGGIRKDVARVDSRRFAVKVERDRLMSPASLERLVERYASEGRVFAPAAPDRLVFEKAEKR